MNMNEGGGQQVTALMTALIRRGELRPGDLLVLSCPGMMADRTYTRLVRQIGAGVSEGVKVVLFEDGITVDAILSNAGEQRRDGMVGMTGDRDQFVRLRKALIGLVGAEDVEELKAMEQTMLLLPAPDEVKAATINAIHALIETADDGSDAAAQA